MRNRIPLTGTAPLLAGLTASAVIADPADQLATEMMAVIQIEAGHQERGQTIQSLVDCLRDWNLGDGRPPNDVVIRGTGADTFSVQTDLRSRSYFHFQALQERGELVAVLVEIEFPRDGKAYQHVIDIESKRAVMQAVCPG